MKKYKLLFIFLAACFQAMTAQTTSFIYYGVEQGLPQSQVQCIAQDNDGNLWVGTLSGLSRYNGREFRVYSRIDSLAEDWVTAMCRDKAGNIWFGHWAGGVSMFNYKTQKIENLNLEEYTRFKTVTSIIQDEKDRFWIATEGSGIFIYDPVKNRMFALNVKDGLASANVYDLARKPRGHLGFGGAVHACLGSAIARMAVAIAMEEFHKVVPVYSRVQEQLPWMLSSTFRSPMVLELAQP